jgi:hexokinase
MPDRRDLLKRLRRDFCIDRAGMYGIVRGLHREMASGLSGRRSDLKMLPAYVDRPSGDETGRYLALDLGGSNFRVLELGLAGSGRSTAPLVTKFALSEHIMRGEGRLLFKFLASCIRKFLRTNRIGTRGSISLGFTFSFAVDQDRLDRGRLVGWTKGFSARGVVGRDVVGLLMSALRAEGLGNVRVTALTNDTVGTLVAGAYAEADCDVGVIIGTGTNACYVERTSAIRRLRGRFASGHMIVNTEWGNFSGVPGTRYDAELDRNSLNRGRQMLEKMVSGMYLGELVRLIIGDFAGMGAIFADLRPGELPRYMGLGSECVSRIMADRSAKLTETARVLSSVGIKRSSVADRSAVRSVCSIVSERAARISAATVVAAVTKMDPDVARRHTVAIDGSVYEKLYGFSGRMAASLGTLLGRRASRVRLVLTKDGSGRGAAIVAAVAERDRNI